MSRRGRRVSGRRYLDKQVVEFRASTRDRKDNHTSTDKAYSKAVVILRKGKFESFLNLESANYPYRGYKNRNGAFKASATEIVWKLHALGIHKRVLDRFRKNIRGN